MIAISPLLWTFLKPYQQSRVKTFLNPDLDPLGSGYHIIQSKIAIGSGGTRGNGFLGGSQSSLDFIPEKETDFVFSIFAEQFGFIGSIILISIFILLIIIPIIKSIIKGKSKTVKKDGLSQSSATEKQAEMLRQMSEDANKLKQRGFSDDRINELLEEAYDLGKPSDLKKALEKPIIRNNKTDGGILQDDEERYGMKDGGPGIEALREEAPEVVERMGYQEGGSMDDQMLMVMTPPMESEMESDDDMEDGYTRFIMEEALSEEEEDMLTSKLEQDEELSMLFDKIIDVAQEFAGSGPVEGPGSGVSDSIPARLSDGEFVFTAKAVEEIGEDALMSMMKEAEAAADKRQGFAEGELVEEETVTMPVERQPVEQNIRVTKETVGPQAGMLEQDDLVDSEVKKSMFRQNRFL